MNSINCCGFMKNLVSECRVHIFANCCITEHGEHWKGNQSILFRVKKLIKPIQDPRDTT